MIDFPYSQQAAAQLFHVIRHCVQPLTGATICWPSQSEFCFAGC